MDYMLLQSKHSITYKPTSTFKGYEVFSEKLEGFGETFTSLEIISEFFVEGRRRNVGSWRMGVFG